MGQAARGPPPAAGKCKAAKTEGGILGEGTLHKGTKCGTKVKLCYQLSEVSLAWEPLEHAFCLTPWSRHSFTLREGRWASGLLIVDC